MDPITLLSLLLGAAGGAGVLLVTRELAPAPPPLAASLQRLHPHLTRDRRAGMRRLAGLAPLPRESLALLGRHPRDYYTALVAGAVAGLCLPIVLAAMFTLSGRVHLTAALASIGLIASVVAAVAGAVVAHLEVVSRAARIRQQFRPTVATYLSLVAMERAAGHGSVESLERAAAIGDSEPVRRIREALQRARTHRRAPWDELQVVAAELGVPELADVGQIMHGSGVSGAQVHRTLLQRAESLRDQIRNEALAAAERTTTKLEIPGVFLLFLLVAYFLFPVTQQISF